MGPNDYSNKGYAEESDSPDEPGLSRRVRIRRSNLAVTAIALVGLAVLAGVAEWQKPHGDPLEAPPSLLSYQGFFFPLERNRFLRPDPDVKGAKTAQHDLNAVVFSLNGENGWAVGKNGTLLHTENGARSWTLRTLTKESTETQPAERPKPSAASLISPAFAEMPDAQGVQSPPMQQRPIEPVRADASPPPQAQPQKSDREQQLTQQLQKLNTLREKLIDQRRGSSNPELLKQLEEIDRRLTEVRKSLDLNSNGNAPAADDAQPAAAGTQSPKAPPLGVVTVVPNFNDVHFLVDGKRGWMVGSGGTILYTRDGGARWEPQPSGSPAELRAVAFDANGQRGWVVGSGGDILVTDNGGQRWDRRATGAKDTLNAVVVTENGPGWAVGDAGVIVYTTDRGLNWQLHKESFDTPLRSLSAAATGQRAVAVGDGGVIVSTADSGATWQVHNTRADHNLSAVLFTATGQLGWGVGDAGTVLTTKDGATKWFSTAVSPRTHLRSVAFADDARRGLVVGDAFTILTTNDSGSTWHRATHQRFPAPWFYVTGLLLLAWLGIRYYRNYRHAQEDDSVASIVDKGESDEPVASITQDRLGFTALVKGLAGYLRNRATVPPLTIAISAPWGGGKSSLMSMLRTEMRAVGVRSVWFNAWHHQKEEVMLAALLESIRAQALPFWLTPEGVTFRAKLLWRRARTHPFFAFVGCCTLFLAGWHLLGALFAWIDDKSTFAGGWVEYTAHTVATVWDASDAGVDADKHLLDKLFDGKLTEFVVSTLSTVFGRPETLLYSVELAVLAAAIVMVVVYGLRSFPGSPGVLLASVASQFRIAQVQAQTSYRQRFRKHFLDVCEALRPRTMLIFIDDLDRCEPAKTAEMLEAINYLANSGPCFLVVGMARDIVEAQLAIHLDKIAEAHAEAAPPADPLVPQPIASSVRERGRIHYVQSYLRKLINLEIQIPELTREKMYALLGVDHEAEDEPEEDEDSRSRTRRIADALERTWLRYSALILSTALVLAAIGLVMYVQAGIKDWDTKRVAKIGDERKAAAQRVETIRDFELRAAVALDFARGKEKRIATRLFERYKVAVAGLEFRLPLGDFTAGKTPPSELCKEELAANAKQLDAGDVDQSVELACWKKSATATRAVEQRLNDIKASLAAATSAKNHDAFDRIARELAKAKKLTDEAEHLSGTARETAAATDAPVSTVASSAPIATSSSRDAPEGARESEHMTWPYWLMLAILLPGAFYALTRREPFVLKDEPYFRDALRTWSPLLGSESTFTVPREVKRFQNRARFYAMRLRDPAPRRHWYDRMVNWIEAREERWQMRTH